MNNLFAMRADSWDSFTRTELENILNNSEAQMTQAQNYIDELREWCFKKCSVRRFFVPITAKVKCSVCGKSEEQTFYSYDDCRQAKLFYTCWDDTEDIPF